MMSGTQNERPPYQDEDELPHDGGEAIAVSAARDARTVMRVAGAPVGPREVTQSRNLALLDPDTAAGCKRYYDAIAARDLESVLDAMTPEYGRHLIDMRNLPDFGAFFLLWCECQGRLARVISSSVRGDSASVAFETDKAIAFAKLRRIGGRWLIDSEQVKQARKISPFQRSKIERG
jgi:hypothetical protein